MSSSLGSISHGGGGGDEEAEEDEVPEEIEVEEIEEVISAPASTNSLQGAASSPRKKQQQKSRSLFNLDDCPSTVGAMNPSKYDSDDLLAGSNLAVHFEAESNPSDSLDQLLNDLHAEDAAAEERDESPPSEVILLNDQIVSINSLKEQQEHQHHDDHNHPQTEPGTTTNCSTTNDISEIIPDDVSSQQPKYSEDTTEHEGEEEEEEVATPTVVPSESFEPEQTTTTTRDSPIMEMKTIPPVISDPTEIASPVTIVKPMERCLDFGKEVLEDISEESEQALESLKVDELRVYSVTKPSPPVLLKTFSEGSFFDPKAEPASSSPGDMPLQETAFNSLDGNKLNKRTLDASDILLKEALSKESLSIVTNTSVTEYRVLQDEYLSRVYNIKGEIAERDELIEKLTESLQESLNERDHLQERGLEMAEELKALKGQLTEAVESLKQQHQLPPWRSDDRLASQRLSEVSMELVSDDDEGDGDLTKQIEAFQKYLNAEELRVFLMVQKKFGAYLEEELGRVRLKHDGELKLLRDSLATEKETLERELAQSRDVKAVEVVVAQVKEELQVKHALEMAGLREYFEKKCTELEKQYSEDVISQSQKHSSLDSESELSGDDELPIGGMVMSPRKAPILEGVKEVDLKGKSTSEVKSVYEERIRTINLRYEDQLNVLRGKLQHYERRNADDELMTNESTQEDHRPKGEEEAIHTNNNNNNNIITNNDQNELSQIIAEYDRRLQEQVTLARQDVLVELEKTIQALLSETATEDSHWPPELILIREKFTAKNQLEITQLQIQHADEMARLKQDLERQMSRKLKRHTTFDSNRNLDHVVSERDNLRDLSTTLRRLLHELAKYCAICESDLNNSLGAELRRHGAFDVSVNGQDGDRFNESTEDGGLGGNGVTINQSTSSTTTSSKRNRQCLDMSCLLSLIDDPSLLEFISGPAAATDLEFNLEEHLDQLNLEAIHILKLSEKLRGQDDGLLSLSGSEADDGVGGGSEKGDESCEEQEDGLRSRQVMKNGNGGIGPLRQNSLNGGYSPKKANGVKQREEEARSLPSIKALHADFSPEDQQKINIHFNELKNRLQKSEDDRRSLEVQLAKVRSRNSSLVEELAQTKEILEIGREEVCEGFGANSPVKGLSAPRLGFGELQEKAKAMLTTAAVMKVGGDEEESASGGNNASAAQLMQFIEDFCREGDRVVDENKRDKGDLQKQIEAADKQLKSTRQFLEEQAIEREHERDDFAREIDRLKGELRDRDKGKSSHEMLKKEILSLETQLKEMTVVDTENELKRQRLEDELKATVDKIFVLREIITGLEKQTEESTTRETALQLRVDELQELLKVHTQHTDNLHEESLQMEMDGKGYQSRIIELEDKLMSLKPSAEQSLLFDQLSEQLKEIETALEAKTKTLEALHADICSQSCSSPSEDVSVLRHLGGGDNNEQVAAAGEEDVSPRSNPSTYTVDRMQRVLERLQKHTQVEQAAIKRIKDLELQMGAIRTSNLDLQHEKDMLQERMSEHLLRISTLQSHLDEQRHRVEEMHRQGTTDLTLRVHDLQVELGNAHETLATKEKQITTLRGHLEQSKVIIARQEEVIAEGGEPREPNEVVDGLEAELHDKCEEIGRLREKIKSQMVNKMALPDLMETIMAEKNEEIDALKEELERRDHALEVYTQLELNEEQMERMRRLTLEQQQDVKLSARTLSDVVSISDYDVPDVMRRAESRHVMAEGLTLQHPQLTFDFIRGASNVTKSTPAMERIDSAVEANMLTITPEPIPRHINFSLIDETKEQSTRHLSDEMERLRGELRQRMEENGVLQRELGEKAQLLVGLRAESETVKANMGRYEALQRDLAEKDKEVVALREKVRVFDEEVQQLRANVEEKSVVRAGAVDAIKDLEQIGVLEEEVEGLKRVLSQRDEQLLKLERETLGYARLEKNYEMEMGALRKELIGKSLALEKCKLDLDESINNVLKLHLQLERVKERYEANAHAQLQMDDDLAEKVEEELNLSARLDSSILKAIESDAGEEEQQHQLKHARSPISSRSVQGLIEQADHLDDELRELRDSLNREASRNEELLAQNRELTEQLVEFRQKYETERSNCLRIQMVLESEKRGSLTLQQQDAELLDQMRQRLEEAMENEARLQRIVEEERTKVDRLSNVLQRSKSRESLIKSPTESSLSPRRAGPNDPEVLRLTGELRLATAQNEREKERVRDLHKTLERERERFEREVQDQKVFTEKLSLDLRQAVEESGKLQDEVDTLQEKLAMAHAEIDSLEARISNYEDVESRQSNRQVRERFEGTQQSLEVQDLRLRLHAAEKERDQLQGEVVRLRQDVERATYREIELTRALAADEDNNSRDQEQIVAQLNEMRGRMTDALQQLAQERRLNQVDRQQVACKEELEERANHLFGKYLRVESFRKALVHQKRYLLIVLSAYQESEAKTMAMLKGSAAVKKTEKEERKRRLFKSAVLAVIAIQRMKFIVQRWQSGKRIGAKAIFSTQLAPRRSASASTNVWVGQFGGGPPPSRDRNHFTATVSTQQQQQQQLIAPNTPQLLSSLKEHSSSPFHKYYRH